MFRPLGAALVLLAIQATFTAHLAPLVGAATTVIAYAGCFLTYAFVLWLIRREPSSPTLVGVVVAAVAIRVALVFAEPVLSDDIFRYVWEGRVTLAGYNPFSHAPSSEVLVALRDDAIWPRINHPEISTIYPPVSQLLFAAVAAVGGGLATLKFLFIAIELAAVALAWRLVGEHPGRIFGLAVYALNPLVVLEVAWSGHLDVVAWSALTLALIVVARRRGLRAGAAAGALLGISIGAKLLGVLLIPYLMLRRVGEQSRRDAAKERAVMLVTAAAVVLGSYAVFIDAGPKLFGGFGTYAASWRSNDGIYRAWESAAWTLLQEGERNERLFELREWDEFAVAHGFTKEWEGKTLPRTSFATNQISQTIAKLAAALVVGFALIFCLAAVRDPIVAALIILFVLYVVAPTVHPWYVAWLVPLAALRPHATSLVFSAVVLVSYAAWISYDAGGAWLIAWWVVAIEYGIVFAVMLWEVGRSRAEI